MRARFRGPSGTGLLDVADDATVEVVFDEIRAKAGIDRFTIKYGPPMAMKTLNRSHNDQLARSLGLNGETLTIVPDEPRGLSSTRSTPGGTGAISQGDAQTLRRPRPDEIPDDITMPWPERDGTLGNQVLRVMPSDNSCLFTAFGGALPEQIVAQKLRHMMADYIMQHPEVYTEAVLGCSPESYCQGIQDPGHWGGGIELSILSAVFDLQICTYDVQTQRLITFGELKQHRCILVYSGIHYDRVAFSYSEFPHNVATLPPEVDRTVWSTSDADVLLKAQQLVQKLHVAHYYTDTNGLILKCDVAGCDWIGNGQLEGRKHAELTGHIELSEITEPDGDNKLRRCEASGCDFMGLEDWAIQQHRDSTGHERYSDIADC
ncbi:OTU-like cysteine protease [Hirsutella rhossiliensis]|uniref:Ubiquitin thioesterase OTU n=1 Tax=Hirsutella rhossiliensis TaxID=111463 RepID=A0A9P8MRW7_9HYPO|nr:OTU-like cysteine protease domain-containing protein [Hirsutella rhossiliensis]KAH0960075.1 OTU-like cysteine protease domain-containing protein [Hirsutella rhossiliensis]